MGFKSFNMKTYEHEYFDKKVRLKAFVAEPENCHANTPVVLIAHMWSGRVEFVEEKAKYFAKHGYIGFALDMYGDAKIGQSVEENTALMTPFMQERQMLQSRIQAAFQTIFNVENADPNNIVAIGYCFGGLCVQDLARVNDKVKGVVSVHGLIQQAENIKQGLFKSKMLLLNGSDDPMVSDEDWLALRNELNAADCDWQKHDFGGVMHAFTNPQANDMDMGTVYNLDADRRSEKLINDFIIESIKD